MVNFNRLDSLGSITSLPGMCIPNAWVSHNTDKTFNRHLPTALVAGSVLEFEGESRNLTNKSQLAYISTEVAKALAKYNFHYLNGSCPGIPDDVMREYRLRSDQGMAIGLSAYSSPQEHLDYKPFAPQGFPITADLTVFCGTGFELLNVLNTLYVDLLVCIGGGLGTLLEVCTAAEQEIPVYCYKPAGGVGEEIEENLKKYIASFKSFNIISTNSIKELKGYLSEFSEQFNSNKRITRLYNLMNDIRNMYNKKTVNIEVDSSLSFVNYNIEDENLHFREPKLLIDKVRISRAHEKGEILLNALDVYNRVYKYDGIEIHLSSQNKDILWGPSIDTFFLMKMISKNIKGKNIKNLLEIGYGTGIVSIWLAKAYSISKLLGIDINKNATLCATNNASINDVGKLCVFKTAHFNIVDLQEKYDVVVSNPPYIYMPEIYNIVQNDVCGIDTIKIFFYHYDKILRKGVKIFFLISSTTFEDNSLVDKFKQLYNDRKLRVLGKKMIPFKINNIIENRDILKYLCQNDRIYKFSHEDYEYWHEVIALEISN